MPAGPEQAARLGEGADDDPAPTLLRDPRCRGSARLRRFYEALGWTPRDGSNDDFAAFILGGAILALHPRHLLHAEAAADLAPPAPGTWNGVTLAVNVDAREDVDRVFDLAVEAGARPIAAPQDREWGGRSAYVADPEDNRWEIAWAPGLNFTTAGAVAPDPSTP